MGDYEIRITRQAREQLREIRRYIEKELLSPIAARSTMQGVRKGLCSDFVILGTKGIIRLQ